MGRRGIVWKTPDITADGLKMFACIVMLIQSTGIVIIEKGLIQDVACFPIYSICDKMNLVNGENEK